MGDLRIATLTEEELERLMPDLVHLYERAYATLPEYGYHLPQRIEGYIRWLFRGDPKGFFVAFFDGRVAGFIGVHARWWEDGELFGEIHEFVVDPELQGKGIGTALFAHALAYLEGSGRRKIGLWVGEKNEHAITFYLRRGFHRVGQYGKWVRMVKEVHASVPSRDSGETPSSSGSKR